MKEILEHIKKEALEQLHAVADRDTLLKLEKKYLGRKAQLTALAKKIKEVAEDERPHVGKLINDIKRDISAMVAQQKSTLGEQKQATGFDYTLPGFDSPVGHMHPLSQCIKKIEDIFVRMGYEIVEGPEIESQEYNFDLLNVPKDHPSRDIQDTFYINKKDAEGRPYVLRTQTSPIQIRAMQDRKPPVRLIAPGRVYRNEKLDAKHEATFYQCEGLVIDTDIHITDLIGTLDLFIKRLFGEEVKTRVRPHFYPFTEPSLDIDMWDEKKGWLEMLGSGMVHPTVLKNMGIDPKKYSGFAFGLGIDRFMMLYYGVDDIRLSYGGDMRFLEQF